jgi:peptide/nickel transport system permease protein
MGSYILRRVLWAIPVLIGVTFLAYSMLLVTGDPAAAIAGQHVTPELRVQIREEMGLDDPVLIQYARYLQRIFQGDLGTNILSRSPVSSELKQFFPATIELALAAILLAVLVGIPLGALAGYKHNTWIDLNTTIGALIGVSMPIFWLGLMLLWAFGLKLGWFPTNGRLGSGLGLETITGLFIVDSILTSNWDALWSALHHLTLPALALATIPTAFIARITRSAMLEVLSEDYIRTARAKGVRERVVVMRHALKNAMLPVVTVVGLQVGLLLAGAILTETIFAWPGMGRWVVNAIVARNFPVVQAAVLVFAVIFVGVNLLVDISYAWFDPRIRY